MPNIIKYYIKFIDYISLKTGRATMYLVFVMMFILILSFVTLNIINIPLIWIIEMTQFVMTGYYLLGGGYSLLSDDHVRMDLIYSRLKDRTKATLDMITSIPSKEWSQVVKDASGFWDEVASQSPRSGKVVEAFKLYASTMDKAGYPYR